MQVRGLVSGEKRPKLRRTLQNAATPDQGVIADSLELLDEETQRIFSSAMSCANSGVARSLARSVSCMS